MTKFLTASKPSRRSITAAKRKEKEEKGRRKKFQKSKSLNFDFCACPSQNVVKRDAGGKKGKLLCCKCIFYRIKANLAEIQLKKHQNVQKGIFCKKVPGVNGLTKDFRSSEIVVLGWKTFEMMLVLVWFWK